MAAGRAAASILRRHTQRAFAAPRQAAATQRLRSRDPPKHLDVGGGGSLVASCPARHRRQQDKGCAAAPRRPLCVRSNSAQSNAWLAGPLLTSRNPASTTCHRACNTLSTIRLLLGPCPLAVALPAHPPPAAEVTGCTSPYPKQAAGPYIKHVYPPLLYTQQHPTPPQAVQWVLANKLCQG